MKKLRFFSSYLETFAYLASGSVSQEWGGSQVEGRVLLLLSHGSAAYKQQDRAEGHWGWGPAPVMGGRAAGHLLRLWARRERAGSCG